MYRGWLDSFIPAAAVLKPNTPNIQTFPKI